MGIRHWRVCALGILLTAGAARAGGADALPVSTFESGRALGAPVDNAAFAPDADAAPAPAFSGVLKIHSAPMQTQPVLKQPLMQGRDARVFPGLQLEFFTLGDVLAP